MALGHYDMVSTEWLPFFTLFLLKTLRERRPINPILAGLFAAFAMLCEMIYGVFLALLALIVLLFELRRRPAQDRATTPGRTTKYTNRRFGEAESSFVYFVSFVVG